MCKEALGDTVPSAEELIAENMGLVSWTLRRFRAASVSIRMLGWEDGYAAALLGLVKATRTWKPGKGQFTTWAVINIRGTLQHEARHAGLISLSAGMLDGRDGVSDASRQLAWRTTRMGAIPYYLPSREKNQQARQELRLDLQDLLACLDERSRGILTAWSEGVKTREIASRYQMTRSRVNQVLQATLAILRERAGNYLESA